ncbi:hypothetical protein CHARACLAT_016826, partial [Characodon lateralis]|nr:hypothetical protein [Characodon lateralis]
EVEVGGKPLSAVSLSFISGSSGACFPRVPHFQISYLSPRFKYRRFILLHVICMQLISLAPSFFLFLFHFFSFLSEVCKCAQAPRRWRNKAALQHHSFTLD